MGCTVSKTVRLQAGSRDRERVLRFVVELQRDPELTLNVLQGRMTADDCWIQLEIIGTSDNVERAIQGCRKWVAGAFSLPRLHDAHLLTTP